MLLLSKLEDSTYTQDPEPGGLALSRSGAKLITGWNLLAQVVDRLAFLLYLFTILVFMATYIGKSTANLG